jgi:hypothetical protein
MSFLGKMKTVGCCLAQSKVIRGKSELSESHVALEVDTKHYKVKRWQVDEWWVTETINPNHLKWFGKKITKR